MTSFSNDLLGKKLSELSQSKESIRTLALWLIHHRRHAPAIVKVLSNEFLLVPDPQKVAFLYLVNELTKLGKPKNDNIFHHEFERALPEIFYHIGEHLKDPVQITKVHFLLNFWRSEGFFSERLLKEFWSCLNKGSISTERMKSHPEDVLDEPHDMRKLYLAMKAPSSVEFVEALESFHDLPSTDVHTRNQISAVPEELLESKRYYSLRDTKEGAELSEQLKNAAKLVGGYNQRLAQELEQRQNFGEMLLSFREAEQQRVEDIEKKLQQVEKEITEKLHLRQELKRHRDSLPDLKKLSAVTELPPLPTAQDLFRKNK